MAILPYVLPAFIILGIWVLWMLYWMRGQGIAFDFSPTNLLTIACFILLASGLLWAPQSYILPILLLLVGVILIMLYRTGQFPPDLHIWSKQTQILKLLKAADYVHAAQLANELVHNRADRWQAYHLRALVHNARFQFVEAERDARIAVRVNPNIHFCHSLLGAALLAQGRYAEAREAYREALKLGSGFAINHYNLGLACYRLGEYGEAAKYLAPAHRRLPLPEHMLLACYYLGRSLEATGQTEQSGAAYRKMQKYRSGMAKFAEMRDPPDFPAEVALRADLDDIERRLSAL